MHKWADNVFIASPLPTFSSALDPYNDLHRISSYHTIDLDTPPEMLRKASNLFSAKHSPSTHNLKKPRSANALQQALTSDEMWSPAPPPPTRTLKKKRSLATIISQVEPSSTDSDGDLPSSSVSTSSFHTAATWISEASSISVPPPSPKKKSTKTKLEKPKLDKKKRKKSVPRWETDEPSEETSEKVRNSRLSYLQGHGDVSLAK